MGHFHAGELGVQRQRGARRVAERVRRVRQELGVRRLGPILARHRMAVAAASLDARRRPWASLLAGPPGFVQVVDERLLRVVVDPTMDELLVTNLAAHADVGLLVIDPETRERWRVNGRGQLGPEGLFILVDQVYGNCRSTSPATGRGHLRPRAGRPSRTSAWTPTAPSSPGRAVLHCQLASRGAGPMHLTAAVPPGFVTLHDEPALEYFGLSRQQPVQHSRQPGRPSPTPGSSSPTSRRATCSSSRGARGSRARRTRRFGSRSRKYR